MNDLRNQYISLRDKMLVCKNCRLRELATQVVPGVGYIKSKVMFIGEGPGEKEDKLGKPFVGSAGKFLDELLESIDLSRKNVYITNIVKCRPPQNRDPLEDEIMACEEWLNNQIDLIKPKYIIPLGRHALNKFFPNLSISKEHGNVKRVDDRVYFLSYHPAAALYNPALRQIMFEDFKKLKELLNEV